MVPIIISCVPFAVVVHAVKAVPLCIKLCESICNLCNLSRRRMPDGIGLTLVESCDLLTQTLQIIFDILQRHKCQMKQSGQAE